MKRKEKMDETLQEAIKLIKSGDKQSGGQLLAQILKQNPENEVAWLWMSQVVTTDEHRQHCLEKVLSLNPNNKIAQQAAQYLETKQTASKVSNISSSDQQHQLQKAHHFDQDSPDKKTTKRGLLKGDRSTRSSQEKVNPETLQPEREVSSQADFLQFQLFDQIYTLPQPTRIQVTDADRIQYGQAYKTLNSYHGLSEQLQAAFEEFIKIESVPLFHAGFTEYLVTASYIQGSRFDVQGLKNAESWLVDALEIAPDEKWVLLAGCRYYLAKTAYLESNQLLKRVIEFYPDDFDVYVQWLHYLKQQGTIRQCEKVIRQALANDFNAEQTQILYAQEARIYLTKGAWKKAIKSYKRVIKLVPDNPWWWHNLSIAQLETANGFTAFYSNRRALSLMDFGAARNMQKKILPVFIIQCGAILVGIAILGSAALW